MVSAVLLAGFFLVFKFSPQNPSFFNNTAASCTLQADTQSATSPVGWTETGAEGKTHTLEIQYTNFTYSARYLDTLDISVATTTTTTTKKNNNDNDNNNKDNNNNNNNNNNKDDKNKNVSNNYYNKRP